MPVDEGMEAEEATRKRKGSSNLRELARGEGKEKQ
jgi:hypothetical protein